MFDLTWCIECHGVEGFHDEGCSACEECQEVDGEHADRPGSCPNCAARLTDRPSWWTEPSAPGCPTCSPNPTTRSAS